MATDNAEQALKDEKLARILSELMPNNRDFVAEFVLDLERENARLKACVEYYARRDNHRWNWNLKRGKHLRPKAHDGGWCAREALGLPGPW